MRSALNWLFLGCVSVALSLVACTALLDTSDLNSGGNDGAGAHGLAGGNSAGNEAGAGQNNGGGPSSIAGGGSNAAGGAGKAGSAAGAPSNCKPTSKDEACDGIDNDCDAATPDVCPAGCSGFVSEGTGHMACSKAVPFSSAQLSCLKQSMNVVAVNSATENADVLAKAKELGAATLWLGAQDDQNNTGHTLSWPGGGTISINGVAQQGVYTNFASGQPVVLSGSNCARLDASDGTWSVSSCTDPAPYVCEPLF